jgi:hypothetical protein
VNQTTIKEDIAMGGLELFGAALFLIVVGLAAWRIVAIRT